MEFRVYAASFSKAAEGGTPNAYQSRSCLRLVTLRCDFSGFLRSLLRLKTIARRVKIEICFVTPQMHTGKRGDTDIDRKALTASA